MLAILGKRLLPAALNLFGVLLVTFLLTRALPGDPAAYLAGPAATRESVEQIRADLGLDRTLGAQLIDYLGRVARGDLGDSWVTGQPVWDELRRRFPASFELTLLGLSLALGVAIPAGVVAALRAGSALDHALRAVTTLGVALPIFFTGLLLVYVCYYQLGWFPAPMGRLPVFLSAPQGGTGLLLIDSLVAFDLEMFGEAARHIALPALTLGLFAVAPLARMTRAAMLNAVSSDFVRTARAANLRWSTVVLRYALGNALLPIVTTLGMVFSFLLGANVLVEKVFSWPGIGSFALEAVMSSDYAAVQGFVLCMGVLYVLLNLCVDVSYGLIDPRVRVAS
jgi:peptide/nickel transport system permease protein